MATRAPGRQLVLFGDGEEGPSAGPEADPSNVERKDAPLLEAPSPSGLSPAEETPAGLSLGTCSFRHDSWRGTFYPRGLSPALELGYYARFHGAVEVDATFYRAPSGSTVDRWRRETPGGFVFALKAPRSLTHDAGLSLSSRTARAEWSALLAAADRLGPPRCALLLQLGPDLGVEAAGRLDEVLETIPPGLPAAVEFRHAGWGSPAVADLLRRRRAVRAATDTSPAGAGPGDGLGSAPPAPVEPLAGPDAPFAFVRLLGDLTTKYDRATGALRHRYGSLLFDRRDALGRWAGAIGAALVAGRRVLCFVNNHYEGFAPLSCSRLRALLGGSAPSRSPAS